MFPLFFHSFWGTRILTSTRKPRNQRDIGSITTQRPQKRQITQRLNPIHITIINPAGIVLMEIVRRSSAPKLICTKGIFSTTSVLDIQCLDIYYVKPQGEDVTNCAPNEVFCSHLHLHKVGAKCSHSELEMFILIYLTGM